MNQNTIRTLRRVAFISFAVLAILACAALLVAGIGAFANGENAIEPARVSTIASLITIPVYLFLLVGLCCAVISLVWPFDAINGEPTVEARFTQAQNSVYKRIYPAELLAPFNKYDSYLQLWRVTAAAVCGVSAVAALAYLYISMTRLSSMQAVYYANVIEILLPMAMYTLVGMIFCLAARLVINNGMTKGIAYAASVLRIPAPEKEGSAANVMQERNMQNETQKNKVGRIIAQVLCYAFLIAMAFIVLFPFYWMIISSLKTADEYYLTIPTFFPTQGIEFKNYFWQAFDVANLGRLFFNTVLVGIVSTILSLVITVLSAFAFARLEFKGKNLMFGAMLATMMIPGELFTITNYQTVANWGWIDSYRVLIVPFLVSVFYIYLLRQNFLQIPNELYLAAKVDGTSDLKYLWKVMIPLSLPTLISITILKMMGAWNSYAWPNLVTKIEVEDPGTFKLITNGLRGADFQIYQEILNDKGELIKQATDRVDYPVQMAAVVIVSIPLFLVFVFLRKYIMKGVSRSGIKG